MALQKIRSFLLDLVRKGIFPLYLEWISENEEDVGWGSGRHQKVQFLSCSGLQGGSKGCTQLRVIGRPFLKENWQWHCRLAGSCWVLPFGTSLSSQISKLFREMIPFRPIVFHFSEMAKYVIRWYPQQQANQFLAPKSASNLCLLRCTVPHPTRSLKDLQLKRELKRIRGLCQNPARCTFEWHT